MRPPDLPAETIETLDEAGGAFHRFNEAAGFTRRKHRPIPPHHTQRQLRSFNEAAGFTRRKRRAPGRYPAATMACFNEAAGFTRRKQRDDQEVPCR